jgi:sigma-B regulation protein RsbU (phosphoserine phosphatase)
MTTARAFLRMRASQPGTISEIITAMNRHLTRDVLESGMFMTLFYLTIDPSERNLEWVRAGHDAAIVYDPSKDRFEELMGQGVALGVNEAFDYKKNDWSGLENGQIIAIGTDGIWEAFNKEGEMFGKDRFRSIIRSNSKAGASNILNAVYNELSRYTHGQKTEDDITLVIIKVEGLV